MSTQFDRIFEGLSKNSMSLEDACRVLYSESQVSPESMRVCCERIEIELSQGRITSDAAQLLLDALGERGKEEHEAAAAEEMWVDVPLEPLVVEAPRPSIGKAAASAEAVTEVDLTMDDLLAALDRRGAPAVKPPVEVEVADELAAPVEWMEWEPDEPAGALPSSAAVADADTVMLEAELDLHPIAEPLAAPGTEATDLAALRDPLGVVLDHATVSPTPAVAERGVAIVPVAAFLEPEPVPVERVDAEATATSDSIVVSHVESSETVSTWVLMEVGLASLPASQPELAVEVDHTEPVSVELVQVDDLVPVPILAEESAAETSAVAHPVVTIDESVERVAVLIDPASTESGADIDGTSDSGIDDLFAPRVEHVLRETSAIAAGVLLKDRYRVLGPLAPGGLGQLFEAIDLQVAGAPRVAIKLIEVDWQEEPRAFETLQAIVRHVRRLRHPNILAILDIDRDDKHAIIAMEVLRGCWLSSLVREVRGRGVGYAVAWNVISGIANGLAYAHQHGAVHSELNPHMVFITETGQVKIAGFGLAHAMPMSTEPLAELDGLTLRGYADAYCATHWIQGSVPQGVDDLYPLGVIAYELLTGTHPFNRASPGAAAHRQLQPLPIPGLDRRIRRVIERCLSFDRKDRPATGASFLAHIEPDEKLIDLVRDRFK
jgi:hypothetical protein